MTNEDSQPAGFGNPITPVRSTKDRLNDLSGVPDGYPKGSQQRREEEMNEILKGGVPKSG